MRVQELRLLERTDEYVERLSRAKNDPDHRQVVWVWDFYYSQKSVLNALRTKKVKNAKPDPS